MPSSPGYKRDYQREKVTSDARGEKKKRAARGRARTKVANAKGVKPTSLSGDVSHIDHNTSNNSPKNLRLVSAKQNRSFKRTKNAGRKR